MKLVNVGCGDTFHEKWINLDLHTTSPLVIECDIKKGLPFDNDSIDVIYTSHMIEHLKEIEVTRFMEEAYRVIKKGGVIRVVTPNLEGIVTEYLTALNRVRENNTSKNEANYDWMMLELYDQTVRSYSGGKMGDYLKQEPIVNKEFIKSRIGSEVEQYWNIKGPITPEHAYLTRIKGFIKNSTLYKGMKSRRVNETKFRECSGEIHRWMYDSFSLGRILDKHGFKNVKICKYNKSEIINFKEYGLEEYNGEERKPDSLYMEAIK